MKRNAPLKAALHISVRCTAPAGTHLRCSPRTDQSGGEPLVRCNSDSLGDVRVRAVSGTLKYDSPTDAVRVRREADARRSLFERITERMNDFAKAIDRSLERDALDWQTATDREKEAAQRAQMGIPENENEQGETSKPPGEGYWIERQAPSNDSAAVPAGVDGRDTSNTGVDQGRTDSDIDSRGIGDTYDAHDSAPDERFDLP